MASEAGSASSPRSSWHIQVGITSECAKASSRSQQSKTDCPSERRREPAVLKVSNVGNIASGGMRGGGANVCALLWKCQDNRRSARIDSESPSPLDSEVVPHQRGQQLFTATPSALIRRARN
jgi:hypothetical protein